VGGAKLVGPAGALVGVSKGDVRHLFKAASSDSTVAHVKEQEGRSALIPAQSAVTSFAFVPVSKGQMLALPQSSSFYSANAAHSLASVLLVGHTAITPILFEETSLLQE
jgi:hypothetical protein